MLSMKRNIISILRDRELNNNIAPYFSTSKIVRRMINSDKELYAEKSSINSRNEIFYANGFLFCNNFKNYISVNGIKKNSIEPLEISSVQSKAMLSKDTIFYSGVQNIETSCCCDIKCVCLSQCLFSISDSNYLNQCVLGNGHNVRRIYLGWNIKFGDLDWDIPNERFSLIGCQNLAGNNRRDLTYLLVFRVPLELYFLLEIKEMVFPDFESVKLFQNLLILLNSTHCLVYNFDEFIRQGTLTPYKLGDTYHRSKIGSFPSGIPTNFSYNDASPMLFKVEVLMDILSLNSLPTHYISMQFVGAEAEAQIIDVKTNSVIGDPLSMARAFDIDRAAIDMIDEILFHPDNTGRLVLKTNESVDFYKISSRNGKSSISKQTFELSPRKSRIDAEKSSLKVLTFAYNSELNLFAILIKLKYPERYNFNFTGVVNIYDNTSRQFLRSVQLKKNINEASNYLLYMNSYSIIVFESGNAWSQRLIHNVDIYMM